MKWLLRLFPWVRELEARPYAYKISPNTVAVNNGDFGEVEMVFFDIPDVFYKKDSSNKRIEELERQVTIWRDHAIYLRDKQ
jgi:hypothetical protein